MKAKRLVASSSACTDADTAAPTRNVAADSRALRRTTGALTSRPADLAAALARQSITAPTSIQREALPLAMAGADVLVNASTGSGKTLIFLLPLLQRLLEQPASSIDLHATAECLVLVPTAELAQQVRDVAAALAPEPVTVARLLIATLGAVARPAPRAPAAVAIDEADAILCAADGVARDADALLHLLPVDGAPPPQVLLTTATLRDAHAARLAAAFPAAHSLSHAGALARTLQQTFQYVPRESDKTARLLDLLDAAAAEPWLADAGAATMVFCSGDDEAEAVHARRCARGGDRRAAARAPLRRRLGRRARALRGVAAGETAPWCAPTSPPAASTCRASATSSCTICRATRRASSTAPDGRRASAPPAA